MERIQRCFSNNLKIPSCSFSWSSHAERQAAVLLMKGSTHKDVSLFFHVYLQRKWNLLPNLFNLTFPPKRKFTIIRTWTRVIEAQCFIHNSAVLSVSRGTQFIQLAEERALSERQSKKGINETQKHTVMSSSQLALTSLFLLLTRFHSSFKPSHNLTLLNGVIFSSWDFNQTVNYLLIKMARKFKLSLSFLLSTFKWVILSGGQ